MEDNFAIQLFEGKKVRIVWDEEQEKYWFSVVDIVQVLTSSSDYQQARKYWKVLKGRLIKEGNETVTNCYQLKLPAADGKKRLTDMADLQGIFRIIQSVPSKKAEPVNAGFWSLPKTLTPTKCPAVNSMFLKCFFSS